MSEAQSKLPSFEGENKQRYEGPDTSNYDVFKVTDLGKSEIYHGEEIYLTDIYDNEYDVLDDDGVKTGETTIKYSAGLHIKNHSAKWIIKARINMKNKNDAFEAMEGSALYDLIDSIIDYNQPDTAGTFNLWKGSFKEWQEHINQLKNINVEIMERKFGENSTYHTVRFTKKPIPEDED